MTNDILIGMYDKLTEFANANDEKGAQKYLKEHFEKLPEEVQAELITRLYFSSLTEEAEERETVAAIQEQGISALEALDVIEKKIGEQSKA